jgi:hypothetical protein
LACGSAANDTPLADALGSGGSGGVPNSHPGGTTNSYSIVAAGGFTTNYASTVDSDFDPTQLAIDAGPADDAGGEPSTGIVIFDRSGSMSEGWKTGTDPADADAGVTVTKWVAASRALLESLAPVQYRVTIGAILFPTTDCEVAPFGDAAQFGFMPATDFIEQYIERSPANQPTGMTPLTTAFEVADHAIQVAADEGRLEPRFFVMLVTDGMPNCDLDMSRVEALAKSWLARGIKTYVFGLPGSEDARNVLDTVANAGGTQTIAIPGSPQELQGGMALIY